MVESLIAMSAPVDDNGHPSLAFLRKNSAARRERMEKGLSRASIKRQRQPVAVVTPVHLLVIILVTAVI